MRQQWSLHTGALPLRSPLEIAEFARASGFTHFPVLIGKEQHIEVEDMASGLPNFINGASSAGLTIDACECQLTIEQLVGEPETFKLLEDCGIKELTIPAFPKKGYFVRSRLTKAREALEKLSSDLEKHGVKLILPVSGGSLIPSPSAAFYIVRGLPPFSYGIKLDPGAEFIEGFEAWDYTVALLMDYLSTISLRDSVLMKHPGADDVNNKGWARRWSTVEDGMTDWAEMCRNLQRIDFDGTLLVHPMVSKTPNEVGNEFRFLKKLLADFETERPETGESAT